MKRSFILFTLLVSCISVCHAQSGGIISTIAGNGAVGYSGDGGPALSAEFYRPSAVAVDGSGNLFIADILDRVVRKVNAAGIITTIAGNDTAGYAGNGNPGTVAEMTSPAGVAVDSAGDIFVSDQNSNVIRKINAAGVISTYAGNGIKGFTGDGGVAIYAELNTPIGITVNASGDLFIADERNHVVRKVSTAGFITTVAGIIDSVGYSGDGGAATAARLYEPSGVAVDAYGNLFIADVFNETVRKVDPSGIITTIAGVADSFGFTGDGGPATAAYLFEPAGLAVDAAGNLYISGMTSIRKVDPSGIITTFAGKDTTGYSGDGGPAIDAKLGRTLSVALDGAGNLYIGDESYAVVRKVTSTLGVKQAVPVNKNTAIVPNPNNGTFTVSASFNTTTNEQASLMITDLLGRVVYQNKVPLQQGSIHAPISLPQGLYNGIYILSAGSANETLVCRFVVER